MDIEFLHRPGNTAAKITLAAHETITAESGAMIAMSGDMDITTSTHNKKNVGIFKAAKRLVAGESLFLNHFDAAENGGEIWLGTSLAGDMMVYELDEESLIVQGSCYIACENEIDVDLDWEGFEAVLSGESVFWLHLEGSGKIVLSAFGSIYPIEVDGKYIVDTSHIVAFDQTLDFSITKAGKSWLHSFLGSEGFVCKFEGQGIVWCQSHNPQSFGNRLRSMLRPRK